MKDPKWCFASMRELLDQYEESEELAQAVILLGELEALIGRCTSSRETIARNTFTPV